jgi:hypothetical protein
MGNYINKLPDGTSLDFRGKADEIAKIAVAELPSLPASLDKVMRDNVLVCVVDNGPMSFEAAMVCDTEHDRRRIERSNSYNPRPTRYFLIDRDDARKIADMPLESETTKPVAPAKLVSGFSAALTKAGYIHKS